MSVVKEARISLLVAEENRNEEIGSSASVLKQQTGGWKASSLILFIELCQCAALSGITKNLVVYLKEELLEDNVVAATHVSTWTGTCFLTTLMGAYVSDSYWGNYSTVCGFWIIYLSGLVILTTSASLSILKHAPFFTCLGLYMISLGAGSIKPCLSTFGADQFGNTDRRAKASFFSWYYLSVRVAALFASTVIVWIQDNYGWTIGFGIPTLLAGIAFTVLMAGSRYYSFLDKAAIVSTSDFSCSGVLNPWRLCTMSQVKELKSVLRLLPIWATFILFSSVSTQESSVFVEQAMVMDRRFGSINIPPASLSSFSVLAIVVFAPIYDKIVVPVACKFTKTEGGLPHLQRSGIGLLFSILAISTVAIVETKRLQIARDEGLMHQNVPVPMSIFWQIPQHVIIGIGEVFAQIGMLEFFYDQAPNSMRSLSMALALLTISLGSYVTSFILTVVNRVTGWIPENLNQGHLDRFFWLVSGLCLFNQVMFVYCASRYRYKKK
ncbi:hypothetical protein LUZ63_018201 [Rhynchospora breviuscula]|uniref:Uncharacterized protein n=1 Tax=Rhynchospora breviuscula TaxID=2022672 RepID=A0A9Q0C3V9_9POAL|nr:hypothetical protein LUZ63_018201 [Rhynchospora breviuscula]